MNIEDYDYKFANDILLLLEPFYYWSMYDLQNTTHIHDIYNFLYVIISEFDRDIIFLFNCIPRVNEFPHRSVKQKAIFVFSMPIIWKIISIS